MPQQPLSDDDILGYLKQHPDFLTRHPHAIESLLPPKSNQGRGVVDFQSYLVERLRADKEEAIETTRAIVETARTNMNNQGRMHRAILRLLEAETLTHFIDILTNDLTVHLDVDITVLVVEADGQRIPNLSIGGIRLVPEGTITKWMEGKTVLLQSNISGIEAIYSGGAALVGSQALARVDISLDTPPALIAFGARDPQAFEPGQGTELIVFLARVVERLFRRHLGTA